MTGRLPEKAKVLSFKRDAKKPLMPIVVKQIPVTSIHRRMPRGPDYGSVHARRDDTVKSKVQSLTATLNHRFSHTLEVRNTRT